ncbi:MAG: hypothetical protein LCH43_11295 [Actinobacteria bacterium]|nr:hypothetical protein [Actinomycetota bacterium]
MTVVQLASAADVQATLGRDLTSPEAIRVEAILDKASEDFRRRSRQNFTPGESTVRLKVNDREVYLPQRPVVAVASVTDRNGQPVTFTRQGQTLFCVSLPSSAFVTVTYQHGSAEVPDVVRLCIAEVAKRAITINAQAASGASSYNRTAGPYSEQTTFAAWAVGGQTMLSPSDIALADSYRPKRGGAVVMTP